MEHIYHDTETGRMIMIALQSLQMEAGISAHLLTDPTPLLVYTEPCWISATRDFMAANQLSLQFTKSWNFRLARDHDVFLMDFFCLRNFWCDSDMKDINAVRLHLQVATLSDIATADGSRIDIEAFQAIPSTSRKSTLNWIRQPEITDRQRQTWQQALGFLLDKHGRLLQPLGPWISEPNQQWSSYYNESNDTLVSDIHTDTPWEQFRTYPFGTDTSPSDYFFDREKHPLVQEDIPPFTSLAPADVQHKDDHFCTILYTYRRKRKTRKMSLNPQTEYIRLLPKSRKRLLMAGRIRRNRTKNEFYALLMHTLQTGGNLQCGTDGGLRNNTGTFGLVIAIEDKIVWEGCGPVDGNPDTASSKRSELFGYAGLLEFLVMIDCLLLNKDEVYPCTQVYTYIDNTSVVRQLRSFLMGYRPKRSYTHDADIVSHIRWLWKQLPRFNCHVSWVRAHQDHEKTNFNLLA
jgi:hypothetical protein